MINTLLHLVSKPLRDKDFAKVKVGDGAGRVGMRGLCVHLCLQVYFCAFTQELATFLKDLVSPFK